MPSKTAYAIYVGFGRRGGSMKRSLAIIAIALTAAAAAYSQSTLAGFQTALATFAGDMAGSLAVNSTIGSNWSDAYIGKFPHFGAGATVGAAFVSVDSMTTLFDALAPGSLPSVFKGLGAPIPAALVTAKIGIPFLPLDIGIKGGYIPPSVGESIKGLTGISSDYTNIGIQIRYALVKQNLLLPNVSIGASYNFQKGSVTAPTGIGSQTLGDGLGDSIAMSNPNLNLSWTSNTVDFTAQVSKQLLFLIPYLGAGYTVGTSSVTGGLDSNIATTGSAAHIASYLETNGGALTSTGFSYTASSSDPVFRVYGGLSFRIIIIDIDAQAIYVPATKALGASVTARVQL
jgi:hypothetical protein